jgi:hypothetical protein
MNKILVEESKAVVDYGCICVKIGNRKCYMKLGSTDKDGNTVLIPCSIAELKNMGIAIEESEQSESENEEIDIEESEQDKGEMTDTEKKFYDEKKKAEVILKGSPENVRKAHELLENAKELDEENQDLKAKLDLQAQLAFERKKRELGCTDSEIDSVDKLIAWEKGKSGSGKAPEGSAPLNDFQLGQGQTSDIAKKKFASHAQMVRFLKDNESDPECRKYLDALWKTSVQAMKSGSKIEYNPSQDLKNESSQPIELKLTGKERNDPNSELQQFLERGRQRFREQKKLESERFFVQQKKAHELGEKAKEVETA